MPKKALGTVEGTVEFEVVYSVWGGGDKSYAGGIHSEENPSEELLRHLAGAEAAGVVNVLEASDAARAAMSGHVQSQEDGEAAYEAAQNVYDAEGNLVTQGGWELGNVTQFVKDANTRLDDPDLELTEGDRAWLTQGIADANHRIRELSE